MIPASWCCGCSVGTESCQKVLAPRGKDGKSGWGEGTKEAGSRPVTRAGALGSAHGATSLPSGTGVFSTAPRPTTPRPFLYSAWCVLPQPQDHRINAGLWHERPLRHSAQRPRTPGPSGPASLSLPDAWITGTSHRARLRWALPPRPINCGTALSGLGSSSALQQHAGGSSRHTSNI